MKITGLETRIVKLPLDEPLADGPTQQGATMSFVSWGAAPLGSLLGGALGTAFGLHATLWVAGLATLAGTAFLYFSPFRTLRSVPAVLDQSEAI